MLQVEYLTLSSLIPYARNSRTHSDAQVAQIAASIKEFGFTNPVLISNNQDVIAGHGRIRAAQLLGMDRVPCIRLGHLTPSQRKAYVIADNRLALNAGWDTAMLTLELQDLKEQDFDLALLGFGDELEPLLNPEQTKEGLTDPDAIPEVKETRCKPGDLWVLGSHRLLCGDSTNVQHVERLMAGEKADMVFTDPPYGMFLDTDYDSMFAADKEHRKTGKRFDAVKGDHHDFAPELISTVFACFPDAREVFLWGADYYSDLLPGRKDGSWVVWDKRCTEEMDRVSGNTFELCWSKVKHKRLIARLQWSGHHGMQKDDTKTRVHPTQKPCSLAEWFFAQWGEPDDLVADLFLGSGSTLIACEKTNRRCFGMEIDPHYCSVNLTRWEQFTGKVATLEQA